MSDDSLNDLIGRLIPVLSKPGQDPAELDAIVAAAKAALPGQAARIDQIVAQLRNSLVPSGGPAPAGPAAPAPPSQAPSSSPSLLTHAGAMSLGAILVGVAAYVYSNRDTLLPYLEPLLKGPPRAGLLLALIALAGGVGGLVNGWLVGSIRWLPGRKPMPGSGSAGQGNGVFVPGVAGNFLTGASSALATVWLPLWTTAASPPSGMVYASSAFGAFLVGLSWSRVVTAWRDKKLTLGALVTALGSPPNERAAAAVAATDWTLHAVEVVTGIPLTGRQRAVPASDPGALQAALLGLFDATALRANLEALRGVGKPAVLAREGAGLGLGSLAVVQALGPALPPAARALPLADVARMDAARFGAGLRALGATLTDAQIGQVAQAAQDTVAKLARMPAGWQLTPEQVR